MKGIGGAPTRATTMPEEPSERKKHPVASGVLDYFPDALVALAQVSWEGNEQHNPGQPLHWARGKSADEADAMMRHFLQRGGLDEDGIRHTAKMAWRALAMLQKEIEAEQRGVLWMDTTRVSPEDQERLRRAWEAGEIAEIPHNEGYGFVRTAGRRERDRYLGINRSGPPEDFKF